MKPGDGTQGATAPAKKAFSWSSVRVLVFDRDDQYRFWLRQTLNRVRVGDIISVASAQEALRTVVATTVSAAVIELDDGLDASLEFLRRLRDRRTSRQPDLPVLLISGTRDKITLAKACSLGVEGVVLKPVSEAELLRALLLALVDGQRVVPKDFRLERQKAPALARPAVIEAEATPVQTAPKPAPPPPAPKPAPPPPAPKPAPPPPDPKPAPKAAALPMQSAGGRRVPPAVGRRIKEHQVWLAAGGGQGVKVSLAGMRLPGTNLRAANLAQVDLRDADLHDADLSAAVLLGADLRHANLSGARLAEANLGVARLRHAEMRVSILDGANLRGADLSGADLAGVDFGEADLTGAIMLETRLFGADLSRTKGLTQRQLAMAWGDADTKAPPGLTVREKMVAI